MALALTVDVGRRIVYAGVDEDEYENVDEDTVLFAGSIDYKVGGIPSFLLYASQVVHVQRMPAEGGYAVNVFIPDKT